MTPPVATPPAPSGPRAPDSPPIAGSPAASGGGGGIEPPGGHPLLDALTPSWRRRFGWRIILGCLIVFAAAGGTAAVAVLEQVHTIVQDLSASKALKVDSNVLAHTSFGQPETLLMVGDDTRSVYKYYNAFVPNLANEMLLVRIDPSKPYISMMSLPRELWVTVTEPNGLTYTNRLNSAYTYGTTTLLKTIRQVTGVRVNHVIATTFTQFENAINDLGCVYDTIDERYYHNNADGGAQYQDIDLQPGYQCLDGAEAEQFVSYRHTDTSQVRDARDQSFLLAVKQEYGPRLSGNIGTFERIFGRTVQTDAGLRSQTEILNLANLLIDAAGLHVRQVKFQTLPCDGVTCPTADLTATPQQIRDSVHNFLFGGDVTPTRQVTAISRRLARRGGLRRLPLVPTLASNLAAEQAAAAKLQFTAEFPKVQDAAGSVVPVSATCTEVVQACIRNYLIHAPNREAYPIYVEAFSDGGLGQFYDVQGTSWPHVPLLAHPDQVLRIGRRTYDLFYSSGRLTTVAWHEYGATYWVHNTLTNAVGNGELLAIAEHTAPVGAIRRRRSPVVLKAFSVPARNLPAAATPSVQSIGRIGGLITIVLFPLGLIAAFINWRRIRDLRSAARTAAGRAVLLEQGVAAATRALRAQVQPPPAKPAQPPAMPAQPPAPRP
jgi:LCP family protein required for cell wall assembly